MLKRQEKQEGQQQARERAWEAHPGESPPLELCSTTLASSNTSMMLPQGLCTDRSLYLECFSPDGHDLLSHLLHVFAKMLSSLCMLGHFSYVLLFATLWVVACLCSWDSPGKNTGVGCHSLLQGIFLTQGSNPVLHCRQILYRLSHQGSRFFKKKKQAPLQSSQFSSPA